MITIAKDDNIIAWLNSTHGAGDVLIFLLVVFIVWCLVWWIFLSDWLRKHKVGSFAYAMYKLGAVGTFGIAIFFGILSVLFISSFQIIAFYGIRAVFRLVIFWGLVITVFVAIIRAIRNKK